MFGSVYSKAVELFGRGFLVAAFLPVTIVGAVFAAIIAPEWFFGIIRGWTAKDPGEQITNAILVLLLLYLTAFILYGIRDRITRFLSAGEFLGSATLRRWRRIHFTQEIIDAQQTLRGPALAIPQATTWARFGFGPVDKKYVYFPKGFSGNRLQSDFGKFCDRLQRDLANGTVSDTLPARYRSRFGKALVQLHRLAVLDPVAAQSSIEHLKNICSQCQPAIDIGKWCEQIQELDYGDLVDAYSRKVWTPPFAYVQPTALGNILHWAPVYCMQRYGIELEYLYPRLESVIDKEYQAKIDDRQQFLDFTILLTFLAFVAAIAWGALQIWGRVWTKDWRTIVSALAFFAAWLLLGRTAYRLSLVAARAQVAILTSAIDLFRRPLLEKLKIAAPSKDWEEYELWSNMNTVIETAPKPRKPDQVRTPAEEVVP